MPQLVCCGIKKSNHESNQFCFFPFRTDICVLIAVDVSFPEVAHNQLSLKHIFSVCLRRSLLFNSFLFFLYFLNFLA